MKKGIVFLAVILLISAISVISVKRNGKKTNTPKAPSNNMLSLTSGQFLQNGRIPKKFTCDGVNINPPLFIKDIPADSKSLVLIVDDPDASLGTWTHWLVWNIDPKGRILRENSVPAGAIVGKNDFGKTGYGGPCPPNGIHRYFFKVFALDVQLDLPEGSGRKTLENDMKGHIIDNSELIGLYSRL